MSLLPYLIPREEEKPSFSCPAGGNWYACATGSFFAGCCDSDPCKTECPAGNLKNGSYDASFHGTFPDVSCPQGSLFYTCSNEGTGIDPFWGCCKSNPCGVGCPKVDLTGAYLGTPAQKESYLPGGDQTGDQTGEQTGEKKTNVGAIAGGAAAGGVVFLLAIGLIIFFILRKQKRARKVESEAPDHNTTHYQPMNEKSHGYLGTPHPDAPPGYTSPNAYQGAFPHMAQTPTQQYDTISELPAPLPSTPAANQKDNRLSELPDTNRRYSELETPSTPTAHTFKPGSQNGSDSPRVV